MKSGRIALVVLMAILAVPAKIVVENLVGAGEAERIHDVPVPAVAVERLALGGRPALVHFWGTWCVQCRNQMAVIDDIRSAHPELAVVGVLFRDDPAKAADLTRRLGTDWPQLQDPDEELAHAFGVDSAPVLFFVDRDGIVQSSLVGLIHHTDLIESQLKKILP